MISYAYTSIPAIYKKYSQIIRHSEKKQKRIIKIKNERRCRDVKTSKVCKQGWEINVVPKIKQTTSI